MLRNFRKVQSKAVHVTFRNLVTTADIKLAKSHGDYQKAEALYNEMLLQNNIHGKAIKRNGINKYTLNTMISVYGKQNKMKQALAIFNDISNPDAITFSSIFHACLEYRYHAMSHNDTMQRDYINKIAWNVFENKLTNNNNHKLLIECFENKLTMSAMFDLFIKDQEDQIKKIKFEQMILNAKTNLFSYYPLPIASFIIRQRNQNDTKNDHKLNDYVMVHTTDNKYIGINDNLSEELIKRVSDEKYLSAIHRSITTMVECYQCEYYCTYINHAISKESFDIVSDISMNYDCNFYVVDKDNIIHEFCNGLYVKKGMKNSQSLMELNNNLDDMLTRLKSYVYSPDTDQRAHQLWMDIYQNHGSLLTSEMYGIAAQLLLSVSRKAKISQNQCVRGIKALIEDMNHKQIEIDFGMLSRLLSSFMYLCGNRKHISHGIVDLQDIQHIWNYISENEQDCDITAEHIHQLMYLFGYFNDNEAMLNVFNHFFNDTKTSKIIPNHQIFHTFIQYQNVINFNPKNIIDVMKNEWNLDANVVTFTILFSKMSEDHIDVMMTIFHNEMRKSGVKPNELTYIALIDKIKSCLSSQANNSMALDALFDVVTDMMTEKSVDTKMIAATRIALDALFSSIHIIELYYKDKYNVKDIINKLYQWLIDSKFIQFQHLDETLLVLLVDCFQYFEQFGKIDAILRKSKKRWNSFENIPVNLQRKFIKYFDQRNFVLDTENPNKELVIGDIGSIQRTLNWMLQIAENCAKDKRNMRYAKSLQYSCIKMLNDLDLIESKNYCHDDYKKEIIWTPFSYLFEYLYNDICNVSDTLEWIRLQVPVSSFLLPVSMCIIQDINLNKFIGFSVSTTPNLRAAQYKKILNNLPKELRIEFEKFENRNTPTTTMNTSTMEIKDNGKFQEWLSLNIDSISVFNLDWRTGLKRNNREIWLNERGLCRSCWMMFDGINDKVETCLDGPEPYFSYTLKCAEWEAMTKLLNSTQIKY